MTDNNILAGLNSEEIKKMVVEFGQPAFRSDQIVDWVYKKNVVDFNEMVNLPAAFRTRLSDSIKINSGKISDSIKSKDGTTKYLIDLDNNNSVETVLLPYKDRVSICLSTQVGCGVGCKFCATGIHGYKRNLTVAEIVSEYLLLQHESDRRITHIVYMGMGEPLLNYDNVLKSICILNNEVGIAMRHITLSTVGIIPKIKMLTKKNLQITLAISLHAPTDEMRKQLIPIADRFPLKELIPACKDYSEQTGRRITFEYMLIKGVNDSISAAHDLGKLLRGIMCNVNIIPYNHVSGFAFEKPEREKIDIFRATLESVGLTVTQRMEKGQSVSAACGQLRLRNQQ